MFHVCRAKDWTGAYLVNGLMTPQAHLGEGLLFTDLDPKTVPIWLDQIDGVIYKWQISVDTRSGGAPSAGYTFYDQSGDWYFLSAITPMVHTVAYNSAKPYITKIKIGVVGALPGKWADAPLCAGLD